MRISRPRIRTQTLLRTLIAVCMVSLCAYLPAAAQTVTVVRNVNLRPDPSTEYAPVRKLTPTEPPLTLLGPMPESGYFHVRTSAGEEGYVWSRNVHVSATPTADSTSIQPGPGVPGSADMVGCGDGLWHHVYNPTRLLVLQDCVTVTGTIEEATTHTADHMRHEPDGDTHGWLKVDPQFASLINAGNDSAEDGNLVFEIVCHYRVTQTDAKPACAGFKDHTVIPPVGTHVAIRGTLVREKNHKHWNEIHPVTSVTVQ